MNLRHKNKRPLTRVDIRTKDFLAIIGLLSPLIKFVFDALPHEFKT